MTDQLVGFALFWGVWMVVPLIIDGVTAFAYLSAAIRAKAARKPVGSSGPLKSYPLISVIITSYNGAAELPICLKSLTTWMATASQI